MAHHYFKLVNRAPDSFSYIKNRSSGIQEVEAERFESPTEELYTWKTCHGFLLLPILEESKVAQTLLLVALIIIQKA